MFPVTPWFLGRFFEVSLHRREPWCHVVLISEGTIFHAFRWLQRWFLHHTASNCVAGGRVKLRITKFIRIHQDLMILMAHPERLSTPSGLAVGIPFHATRQVDEFSICLNKVPAGLTVWTEPKLGWLCFSPRHDDDGSWISWPELWHLHLNLWKTPMCFHPFHPFHPFPYFSFSSLLYINMLNM